jgi:hypothetical protein
LVRPLTVKEIPTMTHHDAPPPDAPAAGSGMRAGPLRHLFPAEAATLSAAAIAAEEIAAARLRHGDALTQTLPEDAHFSLLLPSCELARRPPVYRAHCRALLDRLAAGQDTSGPTDAELIVVLSRLSLAVPFTDTAFGLFLRIFHRTLPDLAATALADAPRILATSEYLHGDEIDRLEARLRSTTQREHRRPSPPAGIRPAAVQRQV